MDAATQRRFETEFAPRIAQEIAQLFDDPIHQIQVEVLPANGDASPARVRMSGFPNEHLRHYSCPLNVYLTWDEDEIESLMSPEGPERFRLYLAGIPRKLQAWQEARAIDFRSRTQVEQSILIGGLDFVG